MQHRLAEPITGPYRHTRQLWSQRSALVRRRRKDALVPGSTDSPPPAARIDRPRSASGPRNTVFLPTRQFGLASLTRHNTSPGSSGRFISSTERFRLKAQESVSPPEAHGTRISPRSRSDRPQSPKRVDLPFTVRIVRTDEQLERAVRIRAEAYSRHLPKLGEILEIPEIIDRDPNSIVFLAEAKNDGEALGTIRIQTNFSSPISLETSIPLPDIFRGRPLAGVSRLAVKAGSRGRLVKLALFKALHRYCLAKQVEWILIGARPPLDQTYLDLGFSDVFDDAVPRPLATAAGVPHRILCFEVFTAERRWFELSHPLYLFMGQRFHQDIEIFSSVNNMWARPRERRATRLDVDVCLEIPLV